MQKQATVLSSGRRRALLPAAVTIAALSAAAMPRPAMAASAPADCEAEWARYNECLMSSDCWLTRKACDIEFLLFLSFCARKD